VNRPACIYCFSSINSPRLPIKICRTGRVAMTSAYRAYLRSPVLINAPLSVRSARSRVVVAGDAPLVVLYLPALSPPLKPLGPPEHAQQRLLLPVIELISEPDQATSSCL